MHFTFLVGRAADAVRCKALFGTDSHSAVVEGGVETLSVMGLSDSELLLHLCFPSELNRGKVGRVGKFVVVLPAVVPAAKGTR